MTKCESLHSGHYEAYCDCNKTHTDILAIGPRFGRPVLAR